MNVLIISLLSISSFAFQCNYDQFKETEFEKAPLEISTKACEQVYEKKVKANKNFKMCVAEKPKEPSKEYIAELKEAFEQIDATLSQNKQNIKKGVSTSPYTELKTFLNVEKLNSKVTDLTRMVLPNSQRLPRNQSWRHYQFKRRSEDIHIHSPIHAITKNANLGIEEKRKLTNEVIKNMADFAAKRKCEYGVEINTTPKLLDVPLDDIEAMGLKDQYNRRDEFLRALRAKRSELNIAFTKRYPKEKSIEGNYFCEDDFLENPLTKVQGYQRECNANIEHTFASNSSEIDIEELKKSKKFKSFNDCLNKMKAKGFKLRESGIRISASSTQLNNNPAKSGFCPWDFEGLSKARAENAKKMILSNYGFKSSNVSINFKGSNRNGSSGPCPYKEINGNRVLIDKYRHDKDLLKDHRYVKIRALFEPKLSNYSNQKSFYKYTKRCSSIGYRCKDKWDSKSAKENEYKSDYFIVK